MLAAGESGTGRVVAEPLTDLTVRMDPELVPVYLAPRPGMRTISPGAKVGHRDFAVKSPDSGREVPVRVYEPESPRPGAPSMLYVHGGGFAAGTPAQFDPICDFYVHELGCVVVSPDYRLAPEHPFPAAVEDCHDVFRWLVAAQEELGIGSGAPAVVGISAGAAIAAGLALLARDRGGPRASLLLLNSPCLDDRHLTRSSHEIADPRAWNRDASAASWRSYVGPGADEVSPYAAPARAEDLTGLPPTYLSTGELEVSRDETIEFAQRLSAAGIPAELHVYPGCYHGFEVKDPGAGVSAASLAGQIRALRGAFRAHEATGR
ncbi:alpha/beta hydrolase [Amycolatopsis sp. GM8]|uniref:alpha/beta hydrolase n=1 Tax=Amycolatopsis sp. GM8 TaxID=2896530 RepID=UPI001F1D0002|nr:alpha/beta hydrolase [Amycolatopsis sp. GM8]